MSFRSRDPSSNARGRGARRGEAPANNNLTASNLSPVGNNSGGDVGRPPRPGSRGSTGSGDGSGTAGEIVTPEGCSCTSTPQGPGALLSLALAGLTVRRRRR